MGVGNVLVDRVGRHPLLLVGLVGMVLSLAGLGLAFLLPALCGVVGWIAIISLMLYIAFFAVGPGPVSWFLISEIYPPGVRGAAMGVASVGNWASNLLVSSTFSDARRGYRTALHLLHGRRGPGDHLVPGARDEGA